MFETKAMRARGAYAAAMLGALCLIACSQKPKAASEEEQPTPNAETVAEVTVTEVARENIRQMLTVTGTISALPNQDVKVSSLVPGRIATMLVAEGEGVSQSQILAKIDERSFLDQVRQAEAALSQAQANLENARLTRARNESLFERGIAARKDVEDARTQESVSRADVRKAEATLAIARLQLSRTDVRSPIEGTVIKRLANVGEQVDGTAGQPIFEVANFRQVELFGNVPAVYLSKIHVGQNLEISSDAFPGKNFAGTVVAISPAVDPTTNAGLVRIRMGNGAGLLRLGMFLSAQVPVETHVNATVVPAEAVYRDEQGQPRVYRVQGNSATALGVKLGLETRDRVEILSGVGAGETIILRGGYGLGGHARVKVKP